MKQTSSTTYPTRPELIIVLALALMLLAMVASNRMPRHIYCEPVPAIVDEVAR